MSFKGFFDFSELILNPGDISDAAMRSIFDFDAYAGKNKFPAVVLTQPVPYDPSQIGAFNGVPKPATPAGDQQFLGETTNQIGAFGFRARIIGPNSPHGFLPDPCVKQISKNLPVDSAYKLRAMHTLFISDNDYNVPFHEALPSTGEVVLVELEKNQFGYNLEVGRYVSTIKKADEYFNEDNLVGHGCMGMMEMPDFNGEMSMNSFRLDFDSVGLGVAAATPLKVSNAGLDTLTRDEGSRAQVYDDKNGKTVSSYEQCIGYPTIGIGHLIVQSERPKYQPYLAGGKSLTKSQVIELFSKDIPKYSRPVANRIKKPVTQEMFDALVSLAFNTGPSSSSVKRCIAAINQGDYAGAAMAIANGPKTSKGKFMPGLAKRRASEARHFMAGGFPEGHTGAAT